LEDKQTELGKAFDVIFEKLQSTSLYAMLRLTSPSVEAVGRLFVREQKELDEARAVVQKIGQQLVNEAKERVREDIKGDIKEDEVQGKDLLTLLVRSNLSVDTKESQRLGDEDMVSMVPTFLAVSGRD
jgi:cytochrome P450